MTPDQLARVERIAFEKREAARRWEGATRREFTADADALTALLREREALRAALAKLREWHKGEYQSHPAIDAEVDALLQSAAAALQPSCPDCGGAGQVRVWDGSEEGHAEECSCRSAAMLTGTTARTEGK